MDGYNLAYLSDILYNAKEFHPMMTETRYNLFVITYNLGLQTSISETGLLLIIGLVPTHSTELILIQLRAQSYFVLEHTSQLACTVSSEGWEAAGASTVQGDIVSASHPMGLLRPAPAI